MDGLSTPRVLGIIAGAGPLPSRVAAAAVAAGRAVFLIGLEGFADRTALAPYPHAYARIGAAGRIKELLHAHGCQDLVLIGGVRRPSILEMRPDAEGVKVLARIGKAAFAGDDGLLAAVVRVLGEEGFTVVGAQDILREAQAPSGLLTRAGPGTKMVCLGNVEQIERNARFMGHGNILPGIVEAVEGGSVAVRLTGGLLARANGPAGLAAGAPERRRRAPARRAGTRARDAR